MLAPGSATTLDVRHHPVPTCIRKVGRLVPGDWVVLLDEGPLSRARLRRIAHGGGLVVVRELIVVPTVEEPAYVVDDVEWAAHRRSLRPGAPWSVSGVLKSGRILIARRG